MEGPRAPKENELPHVLEFLNTQLRPQANWSIANEYPTALTASNIGNIRIITENNKVLSHAVLKPLIIKSPTVMFKVGCIGSVVTDSHHRGQGLSSQILEACINEAQKQSCDICVLWTNLYDFYRKLDFELAGHEESFVFEQEFQVPHQDLKFMNSKNIDPAAIHRIYNQHTVGTVRTAEDIRKFLQIPQTKVYTAWDNQGQLAAFAIEGKGADLTDYIHEWGGPVSKLMALLSYIRSEKKTAYTIIVPAHSVNLITALQRLPEVRHNEGYLGMIRLVNENVLFQKIKKAAATIGINNFIIQKEKDIYSLGIGNKVVQFMDSKQMVRLLFGPFPDGLGLDPETTKQIERVLPLNFWVWGWDSI